MSDKLDEFENRLTTLVKENGDLKEKLILLNRRVNATRLSLLFILLMGFSYVFFQYTQKTFLVRWLAVNDKEGKMRGWWDQDGFEMTDKTGVVRAKLSLSLDGSPYLQFYNQKHEVRTQLFVYPDGSGYLMLWDKDGKGVRYPPSNVPMP